jgi:hypothetical protein
MLNPILLEIEEAPPESPLPGLVSGMTAALGVAAGWSLWTLDHNRFRMDFGSMPPSALRIHFFAGRMIFWRVSLCGSQSG